MGTEKALIQHNGTYLYLLAAKKLMAYCDSIMLSINADQDQYTWTFPTIVDKYPKAGPIGGIMTCLKTLDTPKVLFLAVDMVGINETLITQLIHINLYHNEECSLYFNPISNHYEPLLSIWSQSILTKLKEYFDGGGRSLQQFLIHHTITKHHIINTKSFININTHSDLILWNSEYY